MNKILQNLTGLLASRVSLNKQKLCFISIQWRKMLLQILLRFKYLHRHTFNVKKWISQNPSRTCAHHISPQNDILWVFEIFSKKVKSRNSFKCLYVKKLLVISFTVCQNVTRAKRDIYHRKDAPPSKNIFVFFTSPWNNKYTHVETFVLD